MVVVGAGAEGSWLPDGVGVFFFFAFFATMVQVVAGDAGAGLDGEGGG
jgi:hypothetical protein